MNLKTNGIEAAQTEAVGPVFRDILHQFSVIIEIGALNGGFTEWLAENKAKDTFLLSVEIDPERVQNSSNQNIEYLFGDVFSDAIVYDLSDAISNSAGRALVLCDGGNKIREFAFYVQFLKKDDVIMCHDYGKDAVSFDDYAREQTWKGGPEVFYDHIKSVVVKYGLAPYLHEQFASVFWGSFIRTK